MRMAGFFIRCKRCTRLSQRELTGGEVAGPDGLECPVRWPAHEPNEPTGRKVRVQVNMRLSNEMQSGSPRRRPAIGGGLFDMHDRLDPRRLTIVMWDQAFLLRHVPGESCEDYERVLDETFDRGYNTLRLDPLGAWLIEFMEKVLAKRLHYTLSAWWFTGKCENNRFPAEAHAPQTHEEAAGLWAWLLREWRKRFEFDGLIYVDLANEVPYFLPRFLHRYERETGSTWHEESSRRCDAARAAVAHMLRSVQRSKLASFAVWSREKGMPLTTSESCTSWYCYDNPDLDWAEWPVEDALEFQMQGWTPHNYCQPQFANWRDFRWHRRLTEIEWRASAHGCGCQGYSALLTMYTASMAGGA